jgi:hypothetical protein
MKLNKLFLTGLITAASLFASSAATISVTVAPGTMTNLLGSLSGPVKVTQVQLTAGGTTVTNVLVYDTPTNVTSFVQAAYTNSIVYGTNQITSWTNYWGNVNSTTNVALVIVTNNVVASVTNSYPLRLNLSALANTTTKFDSVNYYFLSGIWATNAVGDGSATFNITYQQ